MRARYLKAVLRQDVGYFDLKVASTVDVVTSVSNDSLIIQDLLSEKVPNFIMHSSTFFASYIAFVLIWRLVVVVLPTALLLIIPSLTYGRILLGLARKNLMAYRDASEIAEQAVSSIRTVYASTAEHRVMTSFNATLESSTRIEIFQGLVKGIAIGSTGVTFAIWALMVWYSSRLVIFHGASGGAAFIAGITIVNGGLSLGSSLSNVEYFGEASAAAERIKEVIMRRPPIDSKSDEGDEIGEVEGVVEFKMVRFAYPARPDIEVLKGFNLRVPAGRKVAMVGESVSGKSTTIALLQRFYDSTDGEILLDGVNTRRLKLKWQRDQMGLVSQVPALLATTIKENILFGKEDATVEEVVAATDAANASVFISQLPLGYDTQQSNFAIMGAYLTKRVREKMLSKMLTFEIGWFDQEENSSGRICSRLAQDPSVVRSLVGDRMALVIQTLSAVVISYTTGILIAWRLALVIISVQPLVIMCIYARFRLLKTMSKKAIEAQSESSELAAEAINNLRTIIQ